MKDLTIIFLGKPQNLQMNGNIDIVYSDGSNIASLVKELKSKYISFVRETDKISPRYLPLVSEKIKEDFDCCFLNYVIDYEYNSYDKVLTDPLILKRNYPYVGEFIWSFIFNRKKFIKVIERKSLNKIQEFVEKEFENRTAIGEIIYFHSPGGGQYIKDFYYLDAKYNEYFKNIIFFSNGCHGTFNGYISWVRNIGRCFGKKFEITLLYDFLTPEMAKSFGDLNIKCVRRDKSVNYVCDRLITSYSDYYYPKNIIPFECSIFIHGNMSDYDNSAHYKNDIYDRYIAVSKTAAKKAEGYFPTKNIEYITNPFMLDENLVKPHLKLVSAQRSTKVKCPERIEKIASIFDELNIPYTWNVFTDINEGTNKNGLIYRTRTSNPLPYVNDADYFVLLSDSEAMPYCIIEALSVNTKVMVTPLEAYEEIGIQNNKHGIIIPFEYFEDKNKDKLVKLIEKAYKDKDKKINYKFNPKLYEKYNEVFKK